MSDKNKGDWEKVGEIGVDAGLCWVGEEEEYRREMYEDMKLDKENRNGKNI